MQRINLSINIIKNLKIDNKYKELILIKYLWKKLYKNLRDKIFLYSKPFYLKDNILYIKTANSLVSQQLRFKEDNIKNYYKKNKINIKKFRYKIGRIHIINRQIDKRIIKFPKDIILPKTNLNKRVQRLKFIYKYKFNQIKNNKDFTICSNCSALVKKSESIDNLCIYCYNKYKQDLNNTIFNLFYNNPEEVEHTIPYDKFLDIKTVYINKIKDKVKNLYKILQKQKNDIELADNLIESILNFAFNENIKINSIKTFFKIANKYFNIKEKVLKPYINLIKLNLNYYDKKRR